jgi:hypothetical protein
MQKCSFYADVARKTQLRGPPDSASSAGGLISGKIAGINTTTPIKEITIFFISILLVGLMAYYHTNSLLPLSYI